MRHRLRPSIITALVVLLAFTFPLLSSDHVDAINNAEDRAADLADGYMFLDPNDNSRVVAIMTLAGFIAPQQNANYGTFSEDVRYGFEFENTGDAIPDRFIYVTFGPKPGPAGPQTATIVLPDGTSFTAPTTPVSATVMTPADPVITEHGTSGIRFFAGLTDDPFFFDIPAFGRFVGSVLAGAPDASHFDRGRDSFAGYNVLAIALSIPAASLLGTNGTTIGVNQVSQRRIVQTVNANGRITGSGRWVTLDRQGLPAVNTALVPFARKREYNRSSPADDAAGRFAESIVGTLQALGTNQENIGILAGLAVANGDILRLDTSIANTGPGGGNNAGGGFPNGRRLGDDVIDTILFFVANQNALGDNVNANEVAFRDAFPFLAPPHQPFPAGTTDDRTRN